MSTARTVSQCVKLLHTERVLLSAVCFLQANSKNSFSVCQIIACRAPVATGCVSHMQKQYTFCMPTARTVSQCVKLLHAWALQSVCCCVICAVSSACMSVCFLHAGFEARAPRHHAQRDGFWLRFWVRCENAMRSILRPTESVSPACREHAEWEGAHLRGSACCPVSQRLDL